MTKVNELLKWFADKSVDLIIYTERGIVTVLYGNDTPVPRRLSEREFRADTIEKAIEAAKKALKGKERR